MKSTRLTYSVKEFSINPSRVIHRALQGAEVTISLRGVPAVRLVPLSGAPGAAEEVLSKLAALPGFHVAQLAAGLPMPTVRLDGPGPSAADMILEDRT